MQCSSRCSARRKSTERKVKTINHINFFPYCNVRQYFFCSTCYPRFPASKDSQLIIQNNHRAVRVQSANTNAISTNGTTSTIHQLPKSHSASITALHCHTEQTPLPAKEPTLNLNCTTVV